MVTRRAVILGAGTIGGDEPQVMDSPVPLLEIRGEALVDRQLAVLDACGVRHITVVAASGVERLRRHLGTRATVVRSDRHLESNALYSLWLAADRLGGGAFVVDAGLVFTPHLLMRLKWHPAPDALVYDPRGALRPEATKVRLAGPYVVDVGTRDERIAAGEHVGLLKLGREGAFRLVEILEARVAAGDVNTRAAQAIADLAHRWPVEAIDTDGLPWAAVDDAGGLERAIDVVAPSIDRSLGGPRRLACAGGDSGATYAAGARWT